MINLITGVPGSGKTYLSVSLITSRYFYYKDSDYHLKEEYQDFMIFHNISGLELPNCKSLDEIFKEVPFDKFFTTNYQDKINKKYPKLIYIIDECQRYIDRRYKNKDVIFYFDYHRHYNHEIFLITQDIKKVTPEISSLVEIEYRAVKPTFQLPGIFTYNIKSGGEIIEKKRVKRDGKIFQIYKSIKIDGKHPKVKKPKLFLLILIGIMLFPILTYCTINSVSSIASTNDKEKSSPGPVGSQQLDQKQFTYAYIADPPSKKIVVPIDNYVMVNNQLYKYRCPLKKKMITPIERDHGAYEVFIINGKPYCRIEEKLLNPPDPVNQPGSADHAYKGMRAQTRDRL